MLKPFLVIAELKKTYWVKEFQIHGLDERVPSTGRLVSLN